MKFDMHIKIKNIYNPRVEFSLYTQHVNMINVAYHSRLRFQIGFLQGKREKVLGLIYAKIKGSGSKREEECLIIRRNKNQISSLLKWKL